MFLRTAGGQAGRLVGADEGLPEGDPLALGQRLDARLGPLADAALGGVEHPADRDLVGGVDQHPQVGQRVAHLAPLVEAHPTDDLVGLAGADEHLLEDARLGVGAVEDGHVRGLATRVDELVDLLADEAGLVVLVVGDVADDPLAVAGLGPQALVLAAGVVGDDRVGGGQDGLGRAVVLLEHDRRRVGEVLLEVHDVADVGAAERVDRLVGVTDDHQLAGLVARAVAALEVVAAELVDQGVLRVVGVLVLVDEHVPEPAAVVLRMSGKAWNRCTVSMMRSSKSRALASRRRRW